MAGAPLPSFDNTTITPRRILLSMQRLDQGEDIVSDSTNSDSGSTPTHRLRPGNVLVLDTSEGVYVEADDSLGDSASPASVSAAETADSDWGASVITVTLSDGVSFSVTLATADDTDAEVVTALNANAIFAANCIADVSGGVVRIRTLRGGADQTLLVSSDLATAYGSNGTADNGADADYRIIGDFVDQQDSDGTAVDATVMNYRSGHFDESNLIIAGAAATSSVAWPAAKQVFLRRGAIFG